MEENQKDIATYEKKIEEISEQINIAILNDKDYVQIDDGKSVIHVNVSKSLEKKGSYDVKFGGKTIATVKKGDKVPTERIKQEMSKYRERMDLNNINAAIGRTPTEKEKLNKESIRTEKELKEALKEGRAEKLRTGREITAAGEDLSLMLNRMFGERAHEVYRVRDKNDSHKFKYIGKGNDGTYFEPKGSRANEGTNARQKCWVLNRDGTFEQKTVDDMKVFGKYVMATDINTVTDDTKTLVGQRTPRGEYILMPALDHRIADTSANSNIKDVLARGNSVWEIDDVILAAKLGNTIRGTKKDGKLSAEEVEFIKKLKKEGVSDEKVKRIVNAVLIVGELKDQGLNDASIKAILDTVDSVADQIEELKKEDYSDKEIKQVMKLVHEEKVKFKDAKEEVEEERDDDGEEKVRGARPEGPWANKRH